VAGVNKSTVSRWRESLLPNMSLLLAILISNRSPKKGRWSLMNHIEFIEKNVREELMRQGFTGSGSGAYQAVDMYKRMSQASRKGRIFDDVLRHAKLWAEKQHYRLTSSKRKEQSPLSSKACSERRKPQW
jgi:hypothetical protein